MNQTEPEAMRQQASGSRLPREITEVGAALGLAADELEPYGRLKAKVRLDALQRVGARPRGRYVLVSAITPTPLGEGKTTVAIGLAQACWRLGTRAVVNLRQPSLGPVIGMKGGGTGGGRAVLVPAEDLNLHFTGDFHAVTAAHNLGAAFLDNHMHHGNALGLDPAAPTWRRVIDLNDRALRTVMVGLGAGNGPARETGFDITAASEVMSVLSLAADWADLRARLGRMVMGFTSSGQPVTADDLQVAGAMAALLRDALQPNLAQTGEGTPALVHAGPFGNIALGNSSIIADRLGLHLADLVITEAGFGTELGAEKFFNVKCRISGLQPDAAVIVATVRALKAHSGRFSVAPGRQLDPGLLVEDLDALDAGMPNLLKHIENVRRHGVPAVVAINAFPSDTPREHARIEEAACQAGATGVAVCDVFARGGEGGEDLARAVLSAAADGATFRHLYDLDRPVTDKIATIATEMYGAGAVEYTPEAMAAIARYEALGYGALPICMAKTHLSLSGDSALKGRPQGFTLTIRDVRLAAGAGYLVPLAGEIMLMPGLGKRPGGTRIDLLPDGTITGLL